jgi:SAM-dependent methyltransferase
VSGEPPPHPGAPEPEIGRFLDEPTRDLADWRWLWDRDRGFPITSHRGALGRVLVALKKLFRPLVRAPLADLWDRQRVFNLVLIEHLERLEGLNLGDRVAALESGLPAAVGDALRHNDALFARADQKLDLYRREARDLLVGLSTALAALGSGRPGSAATDGEPGASRPDAAAALGRALDEHGYLELERRYRGTEEEIAARAARYLPYLRGRGEVLDLGCGRGEALAAFAAAGIPARGVDASAGMVARCRERGLAAAEGDLFAALAAAGEGSLGGVVSFHVVEHLPPESLDRLVRLAHRALAPGGVLIVETPNPLALVVAARNFWLDPTHRRPVHPESLRLSFELAGFEPVEHLEFSPFPAAEHLPEIDLAAVPEPQRELADRINRLRDRLDDLLFGCQDYALVGHKPEPAPG